MLAGDYDGNDEKFRIMLDVMEVLESSRKVTGVLLGDIFCMQLVSCMLVPLIVSTWIAISVASKSLTASYHTVSDG